MEEIEMVNRYLKETLVKDGVDVKLWLILNVRMCSKARGINVIKCLYSYY